MKRNGIVKIVAEKIIGEESFDSRCSLPEKLGAGRMRILGRMRSAQVQHRKGLRLNRKKKSVTKP